MFHVFSDLKLSLHDHAEEQHILNPSVEYIILTGNIADTNKRSMMFAEKIAELYPKSFVIYNYGLLESYQGEWSKIVEGYDLYINDFEKSTNNLYFPKGNVIGNYDFFCAVGWPTLYDCLTIKNSYIGECILESYSEEFYIDNILMSTKYPKNITIDFIKQKSIEETKNIEEWMRQDNRKQKILISSLGNQSFSYMKDLNFKIFPNINIDKLIWICGGDLDFYKSSNQGKVITLPGLNRTRYLSTSNFALISG